MNTSPKELEVHKASENLHYPKVTISKIQRKMSHVFLFSLSAHDKFGSCADAMVRGRARKSAQKGKGKNNGPLSSPGKKMKSVDEVTGVAPIEDPRAQEDL